MEKRFIKKIDGTSYYVVNEGAGGFLRPPGHAMHNWSIQGFRGGHNCETMSLEYAANLADDKYGAVRGAARGILKREPGSITEEWIEQVYTHFAHCYSRDGNNRRADACAVYGNFWGNAEQESLENARHHLGYLYIREHFDALHEPRIDLMGAYAPGVGA